MPIALRGTPQGATASAAISVSVNVPAGVVDGDFMLGSIVSYGASGGGVPEAESDPTGWTKIGFVVTAGSGSNTRMAWYYRVAASEPTSYTFSLATGTYIDADITAYSGVDTTNPFNLTSQSASGTTTTGTSTDLGTTTVDGCWHVLRWAAFNQVSTEPSGYTLDLTYDSNGSKVDHKLISLAGATGAQTVTISAANSWVSWAAALQPPLVAGSAPAVAYAYSSN